MQPTQRRPGTCNGNHAFSFYGIRAHQGQRKKGKSRRGDGQIGTGIFRGERKSTGVEYLEGRKDELSSLVTEAPENTRHRNYRKRG